MSLNLIRKDQKELYKTTDVQKHEKSYNLRQRDNKPQNNREVDRLEIEITNAYL